MDAVHIGCHHQSSENASQPKGQLDIRVVEHRRPVQHDLEYLV